MDINVDAAWVVHPLRVVPWNKFAYSPNIRREICYTKLIINEYLSSSLIFPYVHFNFDIIRKNSLNAALRQYLPASTHTSTAYFSCWLKEGKKVFICRWRSGRVPLGGCLQRYWWDEEGSEFMGNSEFITFIVITYTQIILVPLYIYPEPYPCVHK